MLQEAGLDEGGWTAPPRPATPDAMFDLLREELAHSPEGHAVLRAGEAVEGLVEDFPATRREAPHAAIKALSLAALAGRRMSPQRLRGALVGGEQEALWREPELLSEVLASLYRRGGALTRSARNMRSTSPRRPASDSGNGCERPWRVPSGPTFAPARHPSRVAVGPGLSAGRAPGSQGPPGRVAAPRRYVLVACREVSAIADEEFATTAAALASPHFREEGALFIAWPGEAEAGLHLPAGVQVWRPRTLRPEERDHLVEHATLARLVADPTLLSRRDQDFRDTLRRRWAESEAEVRGLLQKAYYEGSVLGPDGVVADAARLWSLHGDWPGTLSALFAAAFEARFPRFGEIAPGRRLADRTHTNQIVDQFVRPGEVHLPPASTLEAHLQAYAQPLGLVEAANGVWRLRPLTRSCWRRCWHSCPREASRIL